LLCRNEIRGLAWFKTGILKMRGTRNRFEKGRCSLYTGRRCLTYAVKILGKEEVVIIFE
jgi:hypothetical protein